LLLERFAFILPPWLMRILDLQLIDECPNGMACLFGALLEYMFVRITLWSLLLV
jgi:hypothetical protein